MKELKYTFLYCVFVRTFVMPSYYGFGSGSTRQKVTVPTVPVPQHCAYVTLMKLPAEVFARPNMTNIRSKSDEGSC
jgi:hypothetical protein